MCLFGFGISPSLRFTMSTPWKAGFVWTTTFVGTLSLVTITTRLEFVRFMLRATATNVASMTTRKTRFVFKATTVWVMRACTPPTPTKVL